MIKLPEKPRPTDFPKDYRRMAPGEVAKEGDLCRNCAEMYTKWVSAEVGHLHRATDQLTYVRPANEPVADKVLYRGLVRYTHFVCNNGYLLEAMVTEQFMSDGCDACGVDGTPNSQALYDVVCELLEKEKITPEEYCRLDDADSEEEFWNCYVETRDEYRATENPLPPMPMEYAHEEDCPAMVLTAALHSFEDLFDVYLSSRMSPQKVNELADMGPDDLAWL